MKSTERPDIAQYYLAHIRELMTGERAMARVQYDYIRPADKCHAGELDGGTCPLQPYYPRLLPETPSPTNSSLLLFLRGRVIERAIATECEPIEKEGIICRPDDWTEKYGYAEIKSCWKDMDNFDPMDKRKGYPHWLERMKTYAYATGQDWWNLVVIFMLGNAFTSQWGRKKDYIKASIKTFRLQFDGDELGANWAEMQRRKDLLLYAVREVDISVLWNEMPARMPAWGCSQCNLKTICEYYEFNNQEMKK